MKFTGKAGKFRLVPIHRALESLLREHEPRRTAERTTVITAVNGKPLGSVNFGGAVRKLVDRDPSPDRSADPCLPSHRRNRDVRTWRSHRVIERIMGWAPRLMHERHYLRVADKPMRDAILTLYHDDPVSDRQRPREVESRRPTKVDLSVEITLLDQIESRLNFR